MTQHYHAHRFPNGLQLLVEPVAEVRSAAFTFLTPAGVCCDPPHAAGVANLLTDLVQRGAGGRDSRTLATVLDNLGTQRSEGAEIRHSSFSVATLAENLAPTLEIYADILRRPNLDEEQLEFCKAAVEQELEAVEDDPGQKLFIELRRRALPPPLGQPVLGDLQSLEAIDAKTVAEFHRTRYRPNGAILGVAGAVEFEEVRDLVGRLFEDWKPVSEMDAPPGEAPGGRVHLPGDKVQTHIGIAYPSVRYDDPDFYNAHGAVNVLSGGMSARLFTEVREKRGLCYSVSASYHPLKELGIVLVYAGTTNERAAETLSVVLAELDRLRAGIEENEVARVRTGLKASLVMQEESTSARASVLARSWYHLGRVRSLEEVSAELDRLTPASILGYLERHPPKDFTIVTLGPKPLDEV